MPEVTIIRDPGSTIAPQAALVDSYAADATRIAAGNPGAPGSNAVARILETMQGEGLTALPRGPSFKAGGLALGGFD
eukprot:6050816-Amphidinium_carterae.1